MKFSLLFTHQQRRISKIPSNSSKIYSKGILFDFSNVCAWCASNHPLEYSAVNFSISQNFKFTVPDEIQNQMHDKVRVEF